MYRDSSPAQVVQDIAVIVAKPHLMLIVMTLLLGAAAPASGQPANDATPAAPDPLAGPQFAITQRDPGDKSFFSVTLEPGQSASLVAVVGIYNDVPATLRVYATNASSAPNGGFAAGTETDELTAPATWLDFPAQTLDLGGMEQTELPFTVAVPDDAMPGQHIAALVVQTPEPVSVEGTPLAIINRNAIAVEIIVPGEIVQSFDIGVPRFDMDGVWPSLAVPIINTGNYSVRPEGELRVTTTDGEELLTMPVAMGSVYGGLETAIVVELPLEFEPGDYVVSVSLVDSESGFAANLPETTVTYVAAEDVVIPEFEITGVEIVPIGEPIQAVEVRVTTRNDGSVVSGGMFTMRVTRDGELVEEYVLAQNYVIPSGESTLSTRYTPLEGWASGTYSFDIVAATIGAGGLETVLATSTTEDAVVVP